MFVYTCMCVYIPHTCHSMIATLSPSFQCGSNPRSSCDQTSTGHRPTSSGENRIAPTPFYLKIPAQLKGNISICTRNNPQKWKQRKNGEVYQRTKAANRKTSRSSIGLAPNFTTCPFEQLMTWSNKLFWHHLQQPNVVPLNSSKLDAAKLCFMLIQFQKSFPSPLWFHPGLLKNTDCAFSGRWAPTQNWAHQFQLPDNITSGCLLWLSTLPDTSSLKMFPSILFKNPLPRDPALWLSKTQCLPSAGSPCGSRPIRLHTSSLLWSSFVSCGRFFWRKLMWTNMFGNHST